MLSCLKQVVSNPPVSSIILMLVIFLVPYYLFNGLPPNTPTANILEMFKALAEVGGALVGFAGIVGIFALDAIRSAIGDNNNAAANLRIKGKDVGMVFVDNELMALRNRNRDLGRYMQSSLKDLFLTFVVFILEITFAVLGISGEVQIGVAYSQPVSVSCLWGPTFSTHSLEERRQSPTENLDPMNKVESLQPQTATSRPMDADGFAASLNSTCLTWSFLEKTPAGF